MESGHIKIGFGQFHIVHGKHRPPDSGVALDFDIFLIGIFQGVGKGVIL